MLRLLPFTLRVELRRLARLPAWLIETPCIARRRALVEMLGESRVLLAEHRSPLRRFSAAADRLQLGKERNVAVAARRLDGLLIEPHQVLSYHRAVGRPSRLRGFRTGLELHDGQVGAGVGGGCCQVSNLLYLLALHSGMKVIERHRHGLDLFADHQRSVPFGCGATVFYNYRDMRFENPLSHPVLLGLRVERGELVGQLWSAAAVDWRVEVHEVGHRFFRRGEQWWRENRIRRRFLALDDGSLLHDEEVAHNLARVCYEPEAQPTAAASEREAA